MPDSGTVGQWLSCVWGSLFERSVTGAPLHRLLAAEWERILLEKKKASLAINEWNQATFHTLHQKSVGEKRGLHIEQKQEYSLLYLRSNSDSFYEPNKAC